MIYINNGFLANTFAANCVLESGGKAAMFSRANSRVKVIKLTDGGFRDTRYFFNLKGDIEKVVSNEIMGSWMDPTNVEPVYANWLENPDVNLFRRVFKNRTANRSERLLYDNWNGINDNSLREKLLSCDILTRFFPKYWGYEFTRELGQERKIVYATKNTGFLIKKFMDLCFDTSFQYKENTVDLDVYLIHQYPAKKEELFWQLDRFVSGQRDLRKELEDHNIEHVVFDVGSQAWDSLGFDVKKTFDENYSVVDSSYELKEKILQDYLEYSRLDPEKLL